MGMTLGHGLCEFGDKVLLSVLETGGYCDIPRYRKCYIENDNIIVYGRCGVGNRDEYQSDINLIRYNDLFISEDDDSDDYTYVRFVFYIPKQYKYLVEFEKFICDNKRLMNDEEFASFSNSVSEKDKIWVNLCDYMKKQKQG